MTAEQIPQGIPAAKPKADQPVDIPTTSISPEQEMDWYSRLSGGAYHEDPSIAAEREKMLAEAKKDKWGTAILAGLGSMLSAPTEHKLKALGEGLITGAGTYAKGTQDERSLEQQRIEQMQANARSDWEQRQKMMTQYLTDRRERAKQEAALKQALLVQNLANTGKIGAADIAAGNRGSWTEAQLENAAQKAYNDLYFNNSTFAAESARDPAHAEKWKAAWKQHQLSGGYGGSTPASTGQGGYTRASILGGA